MISPKNLVNYKNKEEAAKAGKNPASSVNHNMRLQFIICKVLQKEAYLCAARSKNTIDIVLMPQGLHNEPEKLRSEVLKAIEQTADIQGQPYDASLLGYGLCSNGIIGLSAKIPLVVLAATTASRFCWARRKNTRSISIPIAAFTGTARLD